jgi:hypothetical protein
MSTVIARGRCGVAKRGHWQPRAPGLTAAEPMMRHFSGRVADDAAGGSFALSREGFG